MNDWLPSLILLEHHSGSWSPYLEAVYAQFYVDFVQTRPSFRGSRLGLKRHPIEQEKESTFWHLISEGELEADRTPDLRRCERVGWLRPMIEQEEARQLPTWTQERRGEQRIAISLPDFSYVLILAPRPTKTGVMYLPWTAYCVEYEHKRRRLQQDWVRYQL